LAKAGRASQGYTSYTVKHQTLGADQQPLS
jgi:hypothetical protein